MEYDAFLSYNHGDLPWAEKLRNALESMNKKVFLDTKNIRTGEQWEPALHQALLDSRSIVLLWSKTNAATSRWVTKEAAAFRAFMFAEENKGAAARRQLIQVCLEGRSEDYAGWQLIDDLNDGVQYANAPDQVDPNRWREVLEKISGAIDYDENAQPVHLLIAASLRPRIEQISDDYAPIDGGKTFGELLAMLGISRAELLEYYGQERAEWRPFRGRRNIRTILSDVRSEIAKNGGPRFRWKPVRDEFWTLGALDERRAKIECALRREPSVLVVDAISMYDKAIFARTIGLSKCVYNRSGSMAFLPPFAFPEREILRSALQSIASDLYERVWIPHFTEELVVKAACALTAPDELEVQRLVAAALWGSLQERKEQEKHDSLRA